jgi:hypothetical protein
MADTLASLRTEVVNWLRGDMDADTDVPLVNSAINDAIEKAWIGMMQVQLARFVGADSPVTFTLPSGAERVQLVSIADPVTGPVLAQIVAGALPARTINGAFTYVTESGAETLPSPTVQFLTTINNLATAALPANPNILNAIGWNFYASVSPDLNLALQNQQPIPFNVTWQEPLSGVLDYAAAQQTVPLKNNTADNISWILHMEVRTSDTLLRAWNQSDIDSMLFRQFARTLSSASEYQAYAWDLINGNRLEFRPQTGAAFTPRYFYIAKPRRLRYDQAEIPYLEIGGVREYYVNFAVSKLKLALDEYLAFQAWSSQAAQGLLDVKLGLTQEDAYKNKRIAPHLY